MISDRIGVVAKLDVIADRIAPLEQSISAKKLLCFLE